VVVYGANAGTLKHAQFLKVQNINAKSGVICLDWLTYKKNILPVLLSKLAFLYYDIFITTTTTTTTFFFFFFFFFLNQFLLVCSIFKGCIQIVSFQCFPVFSFIFC
jgi:hypothetical protein